MFSLNSFEQVSIPRVFWSLNSFYGAPLSSELVGIDFDSSWDQRISIVSGNMDAGTNSDRNNSDFQTGVSDISTHHDVSDQTIIDDSHSDMK